MEVPKRLSRDLQQLQSPDLRALGIYYIYDEADVRKGSALIFGPEGTPYANCPLVFSVEIPMDYPFVPPKVLIETSDGATRFHPNLYIQGKVCLSILGTYSGPKWASTMSIETVLKSIHSLLESNPITNEPGWEGLTLEDPRAKAYEDWVTFRLAAHTIEQARRWTAHIERHLWSPFEEDAKAELVRQLKRLVERTEEMALRAAKSMYPVVEYSAIPYGMSGTVDWMALAMRAREVKLEG